MGRKAVGAGGAVDLRGYEKRIRRLKYSNAGVCCCSSAPEEGKIIFREKPDASGKGLRHSDHGGESTENQGQVTDRREKGLFSEQGGVFANLGGKVESFSCRGGEANRNI